MQQGGGERPTALFFMLSIHQIIRFRFGRMRGMHVNLHSLYTYYLCIVNNALILKNKIKKH